MPREDWIMMGLNAMVVAIGLIGCSTSSAPDPGNQVHAVDSVPQDPAESVVSVTTAPQELTDIPALVAQIDSIYELQGHDLDTQTVKLNDPQPYHLLMFDHHSASGYFEYLTFSFLQFRSHAAADSSFSDMEALTERGTLRTENSDQERQRAIDAERTFSKAGSTYLLLGNVIMHHVRRCNYSNEDVSKEQQLIEDLFLRYPKVRMMQGLCGYGPVKRRP